MTTAAAALVASLQRKVPLMIFVWKAMLDPCASYASLLASPIMRLTLIRPGGAAQTAQQVVARGGGQAHWWAV
jgi:hypothetical protein